MDTSRLKACAEAVAPALHWIPTHCPDDGQPSYVSASIPVGISADDEKAATINVWEDGGRWAAEIVVFQAAGTGTMAVDGVPQRELRMSVMGTLSLSEAWAKLKHLAQCSASVGSTLKALKC